jgi:hypothetical protein
MEGPLFDRQVIKGETVIEKCCRDDEYDGGQDEDVKAVGDGHIGLTYKMQ